MCKDGSIYFREGGLMIAGHLNFFQAALTDVSSFSKLRRIVISIPNTKPPKNKSLCEKNKFKYDLELFCPYFLSLYFPLVKSMCLNSTDPIVFTISPLEILVLQYLHNTLCCRCRKENIPEFDNHVVAKHSNSFFFQLQHF